MVHFPSGGICLLRNCNIPVPIALSPSFPGAIIQTSQSGRGYVNISSKPHVIQGIGLLIFLLVLLVHSLFFCYYYSCWFLNFYSFYHCLPRLLSDQVPQAGLLTGCHIRSSLWCCGGSSAYPAKCKEAASGPFCLPSSHELKVQCFFSTWPSSLSSHCLGKSFASASLLTTALWGESHASPFSFKFGVLSWSFAIAGHLSAPCKMRNQAHKVLSTDSSFP